MYYLVFALVLVSPLAMLFMGLGWKFHPPKQKNAGFAYRTALSSRTDETWNFAHFHMSTLLARLGVLLSVASALLMILFRTGYIGLFLWIIGGQMIFLCLSAFLVEGLLKTAFDKDGNPLKTGRDDL